MEFKTECCGSSMIDLGDIYLLDRNTNMLRRFVCLECFNMLDICNRSLDNEELETLKGYNEELDKAIDEAQQNEK